MSLHLATILEFTQIVVPVAGGVWIAWMAFRWNRQKEHQQWVLDQKKAEWKALLIQVAEIEHQIPVIVTGVPDHRNLESSIMKILPLLRGTLFIYPVLESSGFIANWQELLGYVSGRFLRNTSTNRAVQTGTLGEPVSVEDRVHWREIGVQEEVSVRDKFHSLLSELRNLAHNDLDM